MTKIGIVGYSVQESDSKQAEEILQQLFQKWRLQSDFSQEQIEIVSGLTHMGIPGRAYEIADFCGFVTVGIACEKAFQHLCWPVDKQIIVGKNWGDESETFLQYCDHVVRIGGGNQSHQEIARAKELGKTVEEFELELRK